LLAQPPPLPAWLPLPRPRTARRRIALAACFGILLLLCGDASFAADGKSFINTNPSPDEVQPRWGNATAYQMW